MTSSKQTSKKTKETESTETIDLGKNLKKLDAIAEWFDEQEEVDIEEGLAKVKEAATLIKESRGRLAEVENTFLEIKKEIEQDSA
jgi:hypothetical protein